MGPSHHRRFWCYPRGSPQDGWEAASLEQNSQSGPIKVAAFAGLEHGGGDAWDGERAADSLHCAGIDSEPFGNDTHTGPPRSPQGLTDSFFECRGNWRASEAFTLTPGPRKPGADSFCNHRPFEFGKHAQHLKHRLAGGCRGVEALWRKNRSIFSACSSDRKPTKSCKLRPSRSTDQAMTMSNSRRAAVVDGPRGSTLLIPSIGGDAA